MLYIYGRKNIKNNGLSNIKIQPIATKICHESNLLVLNRVCATCRNVFSIFLDRPTRFVTCEGVTAAVF